MTSAPTSARDRTVELAGLSVRLLAGGQGEPLAIIHHDIGNPGWLPLHEMLAERFAVVAPDLPGYGESERPLWARSVRDEAILMNLLLDNLDLSAPGAVTLVGLGFGGWIAAEMAAMNQGRLKRLVLVGPMGILPDEGDIADQFLLSHEEYVRLGFSSSPAFEEVFTAAPGGPQLAAWDICREMTTRIGWKPYMFSRQLPELLRAVRVPALIVCGADDRIVPPRCGDLYRQSLPNSRLEIIPGAGHFVDLEAPAALARAIATFTA